MRPNVTPQNTWAHLGIGACALLLPPLALGAALYSMLAAPDEGITRPAGAQAGTQAALPGPSAQVAQPAGAESVAGQPPVGKTADDVARIWHQVPPQGGSDQAPSNQIGSVPVAPAQINLAPINPSQVTSTQAAVPPAAPVNQRTAGGAPPAVDNSPAVTAPKRASRRHAQRQQEEYPLQNWLQQIGNLLRSSAGGS
jgi:hypothetical protein